MRTNSDFERTYRQKLSEACRRIDMTQVDKDRVYDALQNVCEGETSGDVIQATQMLNGEEFKYFVLGFMALLVIDAL